MKVYVLLLWFYDGDTNLVNTYLSVFTSYKKALDGIPKDGILLKKEDFSDYGVDTNDWEYSIHKYEIRECIIQNLKLKEYEKQRTKYQSRHPYL